MVKVVDKKGKTHEVTEVMYQKQGAQMGWTLIETEIVQTPTVTPTDETLKFIESQKAALEAPVVETVVPDETAGLKAEIGVAKAEIERLIKENIRLKAELAKKECKAECKEPEIPIPEPVNTPKPVAKPTVKRKPRTKKTTK